MPHHFVIKKNKLALRITINDLTTFMFFRFDLTPEQWSEDFNRVKPSHPRAKQVNAYLDKNCPIIEDAMQEAYNDRISATAAKELVRLRLGGSKSRNSLRGFSATMIERFEHNNQPGNARWYKTAVDALLNTLGRRDLPFNEISYSLLSDFANTKAKEGCKPNTINNYLRAIRAIYREADRQEVFQTTRKYPFQPGLIPGLTRPMAKHITQADIRTLEAHKFSSAERQRAVDFFLIGFYLQGADFIDIANLTRFNVDGKYIAFNRAKTGQPVRCLITDKLSALLKKYKKRGSYLLPIISGPLKDKESLSKYMLQLQYQNRTMKAAAKEAGIEVDLTSKWLRHSWITIAKRLMINEDIRRQAVGHRVKDGSHSIYSDDFRQEVVDAANALVLGIIDRSQYDAVIFKASMAGGI